MKFKKKHCVKNKDSECYIIKALKKPSIKVCCMGTEIGWEPVEYYILYVYIHRQRTHTLWV